MEKRLKDYILRMDGLFSSDINPEEKDKIKEDLLIQIAFFQHERMVHLIVTVTFALLTMMAVLCSFFYPCLPLYLLILLFFVLLIPYIRHYYYLENGVQKLYTFVDRL
jgi:hypothetical protein